MKTRASGILLHVTSLPGRFSIGDLGPEAYRFVDFLHQSGQAYWQVLPLHPTDLGRQSSPYHSDSAFAGNTLFISPELLVRDGLLEENDLDAMPPSGETTDYAAALQARHTLFDMAFQRFKSDKEDIEFTHYCEAHNEWLHDYARYTALKEEFEGRVWTDWPYELRDRQSGALADADRSQADRILKCKFLQYIFEKQWTSLKRHCRERGISILGDMPIYVHHDSADVWSNPEFFKLDGAKRPYAVAGVPPDYFSATGQLWGNPVYDWPRLTQSDYAWWIKRFRRALAMNDFIRIDHFRGLVAYWEIPAGNDTAINGAWIQAPAYHFLRRMCRAFPSLPFIAEDLGLITPEVIEVIRHFDLPGMKVLMFAFGDDVAQNPFAPHNHIENCVVYPGTHDNNTVRGWFENEARPHEFDCLTRYLGRRIEKDQASEVFLRMAMSSVADTAIISLQDVLDLGQEARMNRPGTTINNWMWRLPNGLLTDDVAKRLRDMTEVYGRI